MGMTFFSFYSDELNPFSILAPNPEIQLIKYGDFDSVIKITSNFGEIPQSSYNKAKQNNNNATFLSKSYCYLNANVQTIGMG